MKVEDLPFSVTLRDASGHLMGYGRNKGVHLSHVIQYMRLVALNTSAKSGGSIMQLQMGFWFESLIEEVMQRHFGFSREGITPQEPIKKNNIWMTLDNKDEKHRRIEEFKATWRSMRKFDESFEDDFWSWLVQIKSYLYAVGYLSCDLYVFFINGDYRRGTPGGRPQIRRRRLTFEPWELEQNWIQVLRNAKEMLPSLRRCNRCEHLFIPVPEDETKTCYICQIEMAEIEEGK